MEPRTDSVSQVLKGRKESLPLTFLLVFELIQMLLDKKIQPNKKNKLHVNVTFFK